MQQNEAQRLVGILERLTHDDVSVIAEAIMSSLREIGTATDVTGTHLLNAVHAHYACGGGPLSQSVLAEHLGLSSSTCSRVLNSLSEGGLVKLLPDPDDHRKHIVRPGEDNLRTARLEFIVNRLRHTPYPLR